MKESFTVSSDITSEADDTVSLETAEIVNTETQDSWESLPFVTSSRGNCAVRRGGINFKIETRKNKRPIEKCPGRN